jgi:hypothetical protein
MVRITKIAPQYPLVTCELTSAVVQTCNYDLKSCESWYPCYSISSQFLDVIGGLQCKVNNLADVFAARFATLLMLSPSLVLVSVATAEIANKRPVVFVRQHLLFQKTVFRCPVNTSFTPSMVTMAERLTGGFAPAVDQGQYQRWERYRTFTWSMLQAWMTRLGSNQR